MTIKELAHNQKVALVALLEVLAVRDKAVSEGQERVIGNVAAELGDEEYRRLLDEAEMKFSDVESLKRFLKTIDEKPAQELIYGTVLRESMSEATPIVDANPVDWLADLWHIDVSDTESGIIPDTESGMIPDSCQPTPLK